MSQPPSLQVLSFRHLRVGWWSLLIFLTLGILLEGLHGFKLTWYLGVDAETRRFMWTLAHAHGTLLSLVHLGFASTLTRLPELARPAMNWASLCLLGAGILMPTGFFLGGLVFYAGDPGLGILLVPPGGGLLLLAVLLIALAVTRHRPLSS
jgi:hypothetical protein